MFLQAIVSAQTRRTVIAGFAAAKADRKARDVWDERGENDTDNQQNGQSSPQAGCLGVVLDQLSTKTSGRKARCEKRRASGAVN